MTAIKSEMAGTVLELKVKIGDCVRVGQEVLVLESMKMEVPITTPVSGSVISIVKQAGEFVNDGDLLLEIK